VLIVTASCAGNPSAVTQIDITTQRVTCDLPPAC